MEWKILEWDEKINKRPMGHIAHLRNPVQINQQIWVKLWLYHNVEQERKKNNSSYFLGCGPLFEQTWTHFTQGCFVPGLVKLFPVALEKKTKMWKVYRRTDDIRQAIRKAHFSFHLRWSKNVLSSISFSSNYQFWNKSMFPQKLGTFCTSINGYVHKTVQ